ncbi:MAG: hypothetical protein EB005_02190, partial [Actinobacteria bacterium]|nr:hypothetical protein [Actinomycetota bacterium]
IAARHPDAEFFGIGGPKMVAAGLTSAYDQEKLAVRGAIEVLKHLPEILRIRRGIIRQLKAWRPDVMIGIDAPDFNLPIERVLKRAGVPTVHYVSPTVWAWRRGRGGIARRVTHARTEGVTLCVGKWVKSNYRSVDLSFSHPFAIIAT